MYMIKIFKMLFLLFLSLKIYVLRLYSLLHSFLATVGDSVVKV